MWSIAKKLLQKCNDEYNLPYCEDTSIDNEEKVWLFIDILIGYNRKIGNTDFDKTEEENGGQRPDVTGIPNKEYIEKAIKKSQSEIAPPVLPPVPRGVPVYIGPKGTELEREGNKPLRGPKPRIIVPKLRGRRLKLDRRGIHGKMPKRSVTSVVIHSTEGGYDHLYGNQNMHFIVKKDGTIHQTRGLGMAIDHAGLMGNSRKKAMWNGDGDISLHSIGIEVATTSMKHFIREGDFRIPVPRGGRVAKKRVRVKRRGRWVLETVYVTSTPPNRADVIRARKKATQLRRFTALRKLVHWLGGEFGLKKRDVVTHSMIAVSIYGRGRKADPPIIDWSKLGLPENGKLTDLDVVGGRVKSNHRKIERDRVGEDMAMIKIKGRLYYKMIKLPNGKYSYTPNASFGGISGLTTSITVSDGIRKKEEERKRRAARRRRRRSR